MSKEKSCNESEELTRLKLMPLQVAHKMAQEGLMQDDELVVVAAVTAESLSKKVIPDV